MGSSKADLDRFADPVQGRIGLAIYRTQLGHRHRDAKPLRTDVPQLKYLRLSSSLMVRYMFARQLPSILSTHQWAMSCR